MCRPGGDAGGAGEGVGGGGGAMKMACSMRALLPAGHEAGEVCGVGEEGEDGFERVGQPLLGLEVEAHEVSQDEV